MRTPARRAVVAIKEQIFAIRAYKVCEEFDLALGSGMALDIFERNGIVDLSCIHAYICGLLGV